MSNPLVPQLRADKNGKLVTRHVVDPSAATSASNSLPAPSLSTSAPASKKTPDEIKQEKRQSILDAAFAGTNPTEEKLRGAAAALSWVPEKYLDTVAAIMREEAVYDPYGRVAMLLQSQIRSGDERGFDVTVIASRHEILTSLHNAGFDILRNHDIDVKSYFGSSLPTVIQESDLKDFNVWVIAKTFELEDPSTYQRGPIAHYRAMAQMGEHLDEVMKALPVLKAIEEDEDNYMLEYGFEDIIAISQHVAAHTDSEIERIAYHIRNTVDANRYYDDEIDQMLEETKDSPSLTGGWL